MTRAAAKKAPVQPDQKKEEKPQGLALLWIDPKCLPTQLAVKERESEQARQDWLTKRDEAAQRRYLRLADMVLKPPQKTAAAKPELRLVTNNDDIPKP